MTPRITAESILPLWVTTLKALGLPLGTPYPPERGSAAQYYVGVTLIDYIGTSHTRSIAKALGYGENGTSLFKTHRTKWRRENMPSKAIADACAVAFETGEVVAVSVPVGIAPDGTWQFSSDPKPDPRPEPAPAVEPAQEPPAPPTRTMSDIAKSVAKTFPNPQKKPQTAAAKKSEAIYPDVPRGRTARPPQHPPITTVIRPRPVQDLKPDGSNMYEVPLFGTRTIKPRQGVSIPMPGDKPEGWKPPPPPVDESASADSDTVSMVRALKFGGEPNRANGRHKITLPRIRTLEGRDDG